MSDLTAKFTALEDQLAAQSATMEGYVDTVEAKLQAIANTLDLLNNNGSANTKYLLAALGALDPCKTCPQPSLEVPPVSDIFTPPVDDKCSRVQALLHAIQAIAAKFDILNNFGVAFNPTALTTAFNEIIDGLSEPSTVPLPSWTEMTNMASWALAYAGANVLVGTSLSSYLSPLIFDLRDAMYAGGSPEDSKEAYDSVLLASSVPYGANQLLRAIGYNELFSYYLDPANDIDTSAYPGDACAAPVGCVTLVEDYSFVLTKTEDDGSNYWSVAIPSWATYIQWDITFSPSLNVIWQTIPMEDGTIASADLNAAGFTGNDTGVWSDTHSGVTYFGVGGFYIGLPNGSTVNVTINSLEACSGSPPE